MEETVQVLRYFSLVYATIRILGFDGGGWGRR